VVLLLLTMLVGAGRYADNQSATEFIRGLVRILLPILDDVIGVIKGFGNQHFLTAGILHRVDTDVANTHGVNDCLSANLHLIFIHGFIYHKISGLKLSYIAADFLGPPTCPVPCSPVSRVWSC